MSGVKSEINFDQNLGLVKPENSVYATNDVNEMVAMATPVTMFDKLNAFIGNVDWVKVLHVFLIIAVLVLIVLVFQTKETVVTGFIHKKCMEVGPCDSESCPMNDLSNPSAVIYEQSRLGTQFADTIANIAVGTINGVQTSVDAATKATLQTVIDDSVNSLKVLNNLSSDLMVTLEKLKKKSYGLTASADKKALIIVQNEVVSVVITLKLLMVLAAAQYEKIQINIMHTTLKKDINDVSSLATEDARTKFEKSYETFNAASLKITEIAGDATSADFKLKNMLATLMADYELDVTMDKVTDHLSVVSNMLADVQVQYDLISNAHIELLVIYSKHIRTDKFKERFEGAAATIPTDLANAQIANGDYNSTIIQSALEPSVVANHKTFAEERNRIDTGAGMYGVRDDPNDVIPWVGLFRPTYKKSDGTSVEKSFTPLKAVPSDDPEKQMKNRVKLTF